MWKAFLASVLIFAPAAAQAFTTCDATPLTGAGGMISEEGANPVAWKSWVYAGFMDRDRVGVVVAGDGGQTPGPPHLIAEGQGAVKGLRLAASGANVYAAWIRTTKGVHHLMFDASHDNGATWAPAVDLGESRAALPQIAADGRNVHVAYLTTGDAIAIVNSADSGKSFAAPVSIAPGWGEIVIASAGANVYVSWNISAPQRFDVMMAASNDGGAGFVVRNLSAARPYGASEPIFGLSPDGSRVSLVWREKNPAQGFYLKSADSGQSWTAPLAIDAPARQFMVADDGKTIYVSYLKQYMIGSVSDWQIQLAISSDGGATFPDKRNLSGPTGIADIVDDDFRPMPWARENGVFRLTGVTADGIHVWSGRNAKLSAPVRAGSGSMAAPAFNGLVWLGPSGVVTYGTCR